MDKEIIERTLETVRTSENFVTVAEVSIILLQRSIEAEQAGYSEMMDSLQDSYIEILELSVESGTKLITPSVQNDYKKKRRELYHESEARIARLNFMIREIAAACARRIEEEKK
ncbi:MAG: hypothetical protein HYV45_03870 [Candidatus Moranbacteria bacterium]|nr:hypothetical protein [Candidatus Moranbacteria bacterium]